MSPDPLAPIASRPSTNDADNLRGTVLMLGGFFLYSAADIIAKVLAETMHPVQVVWSRQLGLVVVILAMIALKGPQLLRTRRLGLQILRGSVMVISATSFVFAVSYVPLADAVTVTFIAPFLVTVFGALLLKEHVGPRRWIAVVIGFAGTLIVIRPGLGVFHPAIFLAVLAAAAFASRQILSRILSSTESTTATVAYTALVSSALLTLPLPFIWVAPTGRDWVLLAALTVLAGVAEYLVIRALDIAQAVVVAPMQYSLMIWGTFWGYVVYSDLPDCWTWVGAAIIVASGLYTLHREALAMRRRRRPKA